MGEVPLREAKSALTLSPGSSALPADYEKQPLMKNVPFPSLLCGW
jgi:hypothetical protein